MSTTAPAPATPVVPLTTQDAEILVAPTAALVDAVQPGGLFHTLPTALDRPLLFIAGGVPVHRDGRLIGAVGVGGGAPDQDHGFATAAVEALGG